ALPPATPTTINVMVVFLRLNPPFCSSAEACLPDFDQGLQDAILPPRHTAAAYGNMLNNYIAPFIKEATYNNSNMVFNVISNPHSADGWFDAPRMLEDYNNPVGDAQPEGYMGQDAYNMAFSEVGIDALDYDILLVVTNIHIVYGYATTGPNERPLVVMGENPNDDRFYAVVGHEMGHTYGLYHVRMGAYDIVGNSEVLVHYGGYSKAAAGWVPEVTDMPCCGGCPCEITTVLTPLERAGNNVLRISSVSNVISSFIGFFVECRAKTGFDGKIPEAGVVISWVDTYIQHDDPNGVRAWIRFPMDIQDYTKAALAPGETYVDTVSNLTVTYLSKDGNNNCTVKATLGPITAPDPNIKSSTIVGSGASYIKYKSRDIWIDSQKNGWDVYPFTESYSLEGSYSVPYGYGDPFWVGHENRIKFLVRNDGFGPAENVVADVYVTQPILISVPCDGGTDPNEAELIGSVVIDHLEAGEIYMGSVPYTPTSGAAAQVNVVIRDYVGEITHSNNSASETYASQFIPSDLLGSLDMETLSEPNFLKKNSFVVAADIRCQKYVHYRFVRKVISAIDRKDWVTNFEQIEGFVEPGQQNEIPLASLPPTDAQPGECEEASVELQIFMDDVFVPIKGLTYRSCVAETSTLTCSAPKESLESESRVKIAGELKPYKPGSAIALEFISPKGKSIIKNTLVTLNGAYDLEYLPEETGKWQVKAFWQGSDSSLPAESELCYFEVKSGKPEFTLNHNVNCRSGTGTDYPIITSGRIGDVIPIEARSPDALWLYGTMKGFKCWMSLELGKLNVHPWSLPERQPPPKPIKPTSTPSACSIYTSEATCNRRKDLCK
ncbi:MAG: hypothetical protein MUO42_03720, partial [Anaerolineaceae bacterium]|nr:hypothetical protein [Anaerolineaceae bacterium]